MKIHVYFVVQGAPDVQDSLPELGGMLSPLHDLPPSPGSSASFWLGPSNPGASMTAASVAAASAAAARAAEFLKSSKESLEELLRPMALAR